MAVPALQRPVGCLFVVLVMLALDVHPARKPRY